MRGLFCVAILLCFAWPGAPTVADVNVTPQFQAGATRPVSIAVAPAAVRVILQRLYRTEDQEVPAGFEEHLTEGVAEALRAKGYAARTVTPAEAGKDAELAALLASANQLIDAVDLCLRPDQCMETRTYHVGAPVAALADRLDVDAIAFVRMTLRTNAAAKRIFDSSSSETTMAVSLVDAESMDLVVFATLPLLARGRDYEDIDDPKLAMFEFAEDTLADLPAAVAP